MRRAAGRLGKLPPGTFRSARSLEEVGFQHGDYGELVAEGCKVVFYSSCGEWEIDIHLPGGGRVGLDAPYSAVKGVKPEDMGHFYFVLTGRRRRKVVSS